MSERISERDSTALYFVRSVAILCTLAGHLVTVDLSTPAIGFITRVWETVANVSVVSFLITAGILYTRTPGDSVRFWKRRAKTIILPWLFCGMLTYGYRAIYEPSSLLGLVCWLFGYGSWLYYVTMYLLLMVLFKPIHKCVPALWTCVAITAIQLVMKTKGGGIPFFLDSEYLNPLHWIGFFALGILLRRRDLRLSRGFFAGCALVLAVVSVVVYRRWIYNFFHIYNAIFTVSAFFVLFAIGRCLAGTGIRRYVQKIGESTFCVYLLHLLILPPILRRIPGVAFKAFFAPFLGLSIMLLLIELGRFITAKLPFGDKLRMLVGVR